MDSITLKEYEPIVQELRGNLIRSERWNNNFNRIENVIKENNERIKQNFGNVTAENIPSTSIEGLSQTDGTTTTVLEQLRLLVNIALRKLDTVTFEATNALNVRDVSFDVNTGVFTFTRNNNTTFSFDTALEKIPASFEFVEDGNNAYLKVTNIDGTFTQVDVTKLLNIYTFTGSNNVQVNTVDNKIVFSIPENCISVLNLDSSLRSEILAAKDYTAEAEASANIANNAATRASGFSSVASGYATNSENSANESEEMAILSKSYAVGDTGTRAGEDTDNAKYYMEQARLFAGGNFVTTSEMNAAIAAAIGNVLGGSY